MSGIIKRLAALAAASLILAANAAVITAYADETDSTEAEPSGYWRRYDITEEKKIDNSKNEYLTSSGSRCHYSCTAKYTGDRTAYHTDEDLAKDIGSPCKGESMSASLDVEEPPEIITPGKELALHVSGSLSHSDPHDAVLFCPQARVDYGYDENDNPSGSLMDSKEQKNLGFDRTWQIDPYYAAKGKGNHFIKIESDNILRATFDEANSPDREIWLSVSIGCGSEGNQIVTRYWYEWVSTVPTEPIEVTVNIAAGSTDGEDDGSLIDNDIVNGKPEPEKKPKASERRKSAMATVMGGAAIGASAAFLAASNNNNKKKKKEDNVGYRMIVDKDFGDTLHPGKTYKVYARIEQVNRGYGNVRPADEHTRNITASSKDLNVSSSFESRRGKLVCCATFTFDHALEGSTATISFNFTGKGGTFTENVIFNLNLKREISLLYLKPDNAVARSINLCYRASQGKPPVNHGLFLGENTNAVLYFAVHGFFKQPRVTVKSDKSHLAPTAAFVRSAGETTQGFTDTAFIYKVDLNNRTVRPAYKDKDEAVFSRPVECQIRFTAESEQGAKLNAVIGITVMPRGFWFDLSRADEKQKSTEYMELYTDELNKEGTALRTTLMPLRYSYVQLADPYGYERIVSVSPDYKVYGNVKSSFVPVGAEAEKINNEFEKYLFLTKSEDGDMLFSPKLPVAMKTADEKLMFNLYIRAFEKQLGKPGPIECQGSASARVYGIFDDKLELRERTVALNRLNKIIKLFELEDDENVKRLHVHINELATTPINHFTRWLIRYATLLQEKEYEDAQKKAFWLSVGVAVSETTKWLDDIAFSIALRAIAIKYGKNPKIAEAIITPIKEIIEEYAGNQAVYIMHNNGLGKLPTFIDMDTVTDKFISYAESAIVESATEFKPDMQFEKKVARMAAMLCFAALLNFGKHCYFEYSKYEEAVSNGKPPAEYWLYSAFRAFLKDISIETLKLALSKLFLTYSSDRAFKVIFDPKKGLHKKLQSAAPDQAVKIVERANDAYLHLANRLMKETIVNNAVPDTCKPLIDKTVDTSVDLGKAAINGAYAAYDIVESTAEAVDQVRVDEEHNLVIITAEHGVYKLPTMTAALLYIDMKLEELGVYEYFGDLDTDPITLPEHCPYLSPEEAISSLEKFGLPEEANYIRNTMTKYIDPDAFGSSSKAGRFNARTDFRRYEY